MDTPVKPSESRALRMAPTRPSIMSEGATTSEPARACGEGGGEGSETWESAVEGGSAWFEGVEWGGGRYLALCRYDRVG